MKIFIGADHRGFKIKTEIKKYLQRQGHTILDAGSYDGSVACDYPILSRKVAETVAAHKNSRGILVCMTGIGHTIAANKIRGAYAALCYNVKAARLSREHNNANILVLGAAFVGRKNLIPIVNVWLKTEFARGRHMRRVNQIKRIEQRFRRR